MRVIARRPDTIVGFGETRIHAETRRSSCGRARSQTRARRSAHRRSARPCRPGRAGAARSRPAGVDLDVRRYRANARGRACACLTSSEPIPMLPNYRSRQWPSPERESLPRTGGAWHRCPMLRQPRHVHVQPTGQCFRRGFGSSVVRRLADRNLLLAQPQRGIADISMPKAAASVMLDNQCLAVTACDREPSAQRSIAERDHEAAATRNKRQREATIARQHSSVCQFRDLGTHTRHDGSPLSALV